LKLAILKNQRLALKKSSKSAKITFSWSTWASNLFLGAIDLGKSPRSIKMRGYGSGRWHHHNKKAGVGECLNVSMAHLARNGVIFDCYSEG